METFMKVYTEELTEGRTQHPEEYFWPIEQLPIVLGRMRDAIQKGSYNKDSHAFRATCKRLGIKHTYKAINHFIINHG